MFKDPNEIVVEHKRCIFICTEKFSKDNKHRIIKGKKAEEGIPFLLYTLTILFEFVKASMSFLFNLTKIKRLKEKCTLCSWSKYDFR